MKYLKIQLLTIIITACSNQPEDYRLKELNDAGVDLTVTENSLGGFNLEQIISEKTMENDLVIEEFYLL